MIVKYQSMSGAERLMGDTPQYAGAVYWWDSDWDMAFWLLQKQVAIPMISIYSSPQRETHFNLGS